LSIVSSTPVVDTDTGSSYQRQGARK